MGRAGTGVPGRGRSGPSGRSCRGRTLSWRVVVADQRSPRDGRVIETVGHYNAQTEPSTIVLDEERIRAWLQRGAQPTDTVRKLLKTQNISA